MKSYIDLLKERIEKIKPLMFELIDNSKIYKTKINGDYGNYIVMGHPDYEWEPLTEKGEQLQIKLKKEYKPLFPALMFLLEDAPVRTKSRATELERYISNSIEMDRNRAAPPNLSSAKEGFESFLNSILEILSPYENMVEKKETILIPDVNALLTEPEPKNYKALAEKDDFTVAFVPTVLAELDNLKINHKNPEVKKKAKGIIKRLKGYRQQGDVLEGIIVEKTIKIKMIAVEPDFNKTLTWLSSDSNDDKIIASALEIQKNNPSALVCLITGDFNLQNKAQMANLPFKDNDF